jgi:hypothetical protein
MQKLTLHTTQKVEVYQVAMTLNVQDLKSPFIGILTGIQEILDEVGNIEMEVLTRLLQQNLLYPLPLPLCRNLIQRLVRESYLQIKEMYIYDRWGHPHSPEDYIQITPKGYKVVAEKHFWQPEKGIYNLYFANLIYDKPELVFIEPVQNKEDRQQYNKPYNKSSARMPYCIAELQGFVRTLNEINYRFEEIDNLYIKLDLDESWDLSILAEANNDFSLLSLKKNAQKKYELKLPSYSLAIIKGVLIDADCDSLSDDSYIDSEERTLGWDFEADDTRLIRDFKIDTPYFRDVAFDAITLHNVHTQPINEIEAVKWYQQLLIDDLKDYFMSDTDFDAYAEQIRKKFYIYPQLAAISRKALAQICTDFYQRAKLETIDYLSY